jgi:hypothetical protein
MQHLDSSSGRSVDRGCRGEGRAEGRRYVEDEVVSDERALEVKIAFVTCQQSSPPSLRTSA